MDLSAFVERAVEGWAIAVRREERIFRRGESEAVLYGVAVLVDPDSGADAIPTEEGFHIDVGYFRRGDSEVPDDQVVLCTVVLSRPARRGR